MRRFGGFEGKEVEKSEDRSGKGYRILVVEDDAVTALFLHDTLRRLDHDVVALASTGGEAIRWAEAQQPDVILMDLWLAGPMSGIEAAGQIRQRLDIPVVFVTAHSDESTLRQAQATQPYGFVLKPFDQNDLRVAIEIALHKHRIDAQLRRSEQRFATTLKAIGEAVISTDARGVVDFMNGAAAALAGVAAGEAIGKPVASFLKLVDPASRQPLAVDQAWNGEAVLVDGTGREVPIVGSLANISTDRTEAAAQADGLVLALKSLADQITSQFQIECEFLDASSVRISDPGTANHLFRIAQEAVNNAVKHASPQRIDICLQAADATGCLTIKDNGRGISSASGRGSGLDIMRHRAAAIGGSLRVSANPGGGTVMTCFFPFNHD